MASDTEPHAVVIWAHIEIHRKLPSGELAGDPVRKEDKIFKIEGSDRFIAERKLNEFIQEMQNGK